MSDYPSVILTSVHNPKDYKLPQDLQDLSTFLLIYPLDITQPITPQMANMPTHHDVIIDNNSNWVGPNGHVPLDQVINVVQNAYSQYQLARNTLNAVAQATYCNMVTTLLKTNNTKDFKFQSTKAMHKTSDPVLVVGNGPSWSDKKHGFWRSGVLKDFAIATCVHALEVGKGAFIQANLWTVAHIDRTIPPNWQLRWLKSLFFNPEKVNLVVSPQTSYEYISKVARYGRQIPITYYLEPNPINTPLISYFNHEDKQLNGTVMHAVLNLAIENVRTCREHSIAKPTIHLIGLDCGFRSMKEALEYHPEGAYREIKDQITGRTFITDILYDTYRAGFEDIIAANADIRFVNRTSVFPLRGAENIAFPGDYYYEKT